MIPQDSVKPIGKPSQSTSPPPYLLKVQDGIRSEHGGIEVIVSDSVPPRHQLVEQCSSPAVVSMDGVDIIPKGQAKAAEI